MIALLLGVLGSRVIRAGVEVARGLTFARPAISGEPLPPARVAPALQEQVSRVAVLPAGEVGVVVRDLRGGAVAEVNADRPFPAASLFKLPILVEVLKQIRLRLLDPAQMIEVQPDQWASGSGVLQARVGDRLSVRELMRLMIQDSDNIAALVLLDAVGVDNVNATMSAMGLRGTRLRDRRERGPGENVTTARDMDRLLEAIASGRLIDRDTSEEALRLLELPQASSWLSEGLPWWVKVAHKWGDLPQARHDAGIVFAPNASYVAVVLTEGGSPEAARKVIAATSRAAYDYLGGI